MGKKIGFLIMLILGLSLGLYTGYLTVVGLKNVYFAISSNIKKIDVGFLKKDMGLGGPNLVDSIFAKTTDEQYISDYKKTYKISNNAPVPRVDSKSYLVGDLETGEVILTKNENQALPIASITKLMTSLVADEFYGLEKEVKITKDAIDTYGKQGRLTEGEVYKVSEIVYPLLLESSNDAAEAIAESFDRNIFIQNMNQKAEEIGMNNTNYSDPSGLTVRNVSTVSDLFKLSQYINKYRNYVFSISKMNAYKISKKTWYNNSKFKGDKNYYGGKNGYTDEAGHTQVAIFEMSFNGNESKRKIVFIVLNTQDVEANIYGLKRYVEKYVKYE